MAEKAKQCACMINSTVANIQPVDCLSISIFLYFSLHQHRDFDLRHHSSAELDETSFSMFSDATIIRLLGDGQGKANYKLPYRSPVTTKHSRNEFFFHKRTYIVK
jgi:hypothetical protein